LSGYHFHTLRHTSITKLCNSGVHPKTAQTLARHSSIGLTMDKHTHWSAVEGKDALSVRMVDATGVRLSRRLRKKEALPERSASLKREWREEGA
jgi:site-specific recombinase XerD